MRLRGLELSLQGGPALSDAVIDEMLGLRAQFMRLKPEVDPAEDRALVARWLRAPGCTIAVARDRQGALQCFIDMRSRLVEHRGQAHLVCCSSFAFASLSYRNHPAYVLGNSWNLLAQSRRNGFIHRALWIGAAYPASFRAATRAFAQFWAGREPEIPPMVGALVDRVAPEIFGESWMPAQRLVRMRTLPPPATPESPEGRAVLERYEASNPRWREGFGLMTMTPLTLGNMVGVVHQLVRRIV
jgi:hypothetical protein